MINIVLNNNKNVHNNHHWCKRNYWFCQWHNKMTGLDSTWIDRNYVGFASSPSNSAVASESLIFSGSKLALIMQRFSSRIIPPNTSGPVINWQRSIQIFTDLNIGLDIMVTQVVLPDLQAFTLIADGIIILNNSLILQAKNLFQRASCPWNEGRLLFPGLDWKLCIMTGKIDIIQILIGLLNCCRNCLLYQAQRT